MTQENIQEILQALAGLQAEHRTSARDITDIKTDIKALEEHQHKLEADFSAFKGKSAGIGLACVSLLAVLEMAILFFK